MAMKPIRFNTEMVRAILDGRKTVTRRVIRGILPRWNFVEFRNGKSSGFATFQFGVRRFPIRKSPYQSGDILWVKETFQKVRTGQNPWRWEYKADCEDERFFSDGFKATWRPSIHMPREAARIFLRVTDVQVEHLWDITEEQALKEGIYEIPPKGVDVGYWTFLSDTIWAEKTGEVWSESAKNCFRWIWDKYTVKPKDRGLYGWEANPWVWVISFERIGWEEAEDG